MNEVTFESKDNYDSFKNHYGSTEKSYKDIDVFLWTYGRAIRKYWEKMGVLEFGSVSYSGGSKHEQNSMAQS